MKAYELFNKLYNENIEFKHIIDEGLKNNKIRHFNDNEWNKINSQNFISMVPGMDEFIDMFKLGYNIGNCAAAARQLSYSYDDIDIVSGTLPLIKGTRNAVKEGGHVWLETKDSIIDTSLMLVIDKSYKDKIGYKEEERLTSYTLLTMPNYQTRKEFTNDPNFRSSKKK